MAEVLFSLVEPSSHLTLCLYAKRSAHPDILIGTHEMPIPLASQGGSFCSEFFSFNQLNILRADIPCVLKNDVREAARSAQPVTLYITVNITPPDLLPLSHHQPIETETGNTMPQSREEVSPSSTRNPLSAMHRADESVKRIVPTDRSNTWERAVGRIKWVMDTLGPIAEVRVIPI